MKVAVSADTRQGLQSAVSGHFGKCPHFVLVDMDGDTVTGVTELDNPFFAGHAPGQVPAFIAEQKAEVMLTGGMGAKASAFFDQYGIRGMTGAAGTVEDALKAYRAGELREGGGCSHHPGDGHHSASTDPS